MFVTNGEYNKLGIIFTLLPNIYNVDLFLAIIHWNTLLYLRSENFILLLLF